MTGSVLYKVEWDFPSFSEGLSLRGPQHRRHQPRMGHFPSFLEGLSLRGEYGAQPSESSAFPFLFGGTFIEGLRTWRVHGGGGQFPFLLGGTFIEGDRCIVS